MVPHPNIGHEENTVFLTAPAFRAGSRFRNGLRRLPQTLTTVQIDRSVPPVGRGDVSAIIRPTISEVAGSLPSRVGCRNRESFSCAGSPPRSRDSVRSPFRLGSVLLCPSEERTLLWGRRPKFPDVPSSAVLRASSRVPRSAGRPPVGVCVRPVSTAGKIAREIRFLEWTRPSIKMRPWPFAGGAQIGRPHWLNAAARAVSLAGITLTALHLNG